MSATVEIQAQLRTILTGDTQLMGIIKELYEVIPERATFAYAQFVEGTAAPFDLKDSEGYTITMGFQVFDQGRGSIFVRRAYCVS